MKIWLKSVAAIGAVAGLTLGAQQASAGCGGPDPGAMRPMVYFGGDGGNPLRTDPAPAGYVHPAAITGLWRFTFISDGTHPGPPLDSLVDAGFVTWHDDGTEIMNSGRAPVSGSFCMGVWKQVGASTYKLTHWALSWIPAYVPGQTQSWSEVGGVDNAFQPAGPTSIQETVTLSRDGSQYSGTFTLTQYVYDGKNVTDADPSAGPPEVITGTVKATRITP
jgi:hypothetical protein